MRHSGKCAPGTAVSPGLGSFVRGVARHTAVGNDSDGRCVIIGSPGRIGADSAKNLTGFDNKIWG